MRIVAGVCLLWAGCFYIDPINRGPTAQVDCSLPGADAGSERACPEYVHRGDRLTFNVRVRDQDGDQDESTYAWKASLCFDTEGADCGMLYSEGRSGEAKLEVPAVPSDIHSIYVEFEVRDGRGARDTAPDVRKINDAPTLTLDTSARSYVIGAPISLFARYSDPDVGPDGVMLDWDVVGPGARHPAREELGSFDEGTNRTAHQLVVPDATGEWKLIVTATDTPGEVRTSELPFTVGPDQPPCLLRAQPVVAPDDVSLPIAEPTLFQVLLVDDDLDPYPSLSDPHFGTTRFAWSILPPGASMRQPLTGAGNAVELDPRAFTPGELVELRVEIFDHVRTTTSCADDVPVCSETSNPACVQRQTWRVEVR